MGRWDQLFAKYDRRCVAHLLQARCSYPWRVLVEHVREDPRSN